MNVSYNYSSSPLFYFCPWQNLQRRKEASVQNNAQAPLCMDSHSGNLRQILTFLNCLPTGALQAGGRFGHQSPTPHANQGSHRHFRDSFPWADFPYGTSETAHSEEVTIAIFIFSGKWHLNYSSGSLKLSVEVMYAYLLFFLSLSGGKRNLRFKSRQLTD